jgi:hypothetical protein
VQAGERKVGKLLLCHRMGTLSNMT